MKILITGCAGTLGKAFVRLLQTDNEVTGIDNNEWAVATFKNEFPNVKVILKDFDKWSFNQEPCDLLIHCAAYKHVDLGECEPHTFIENNVTNTAKLFAEAYKYNTDILFISTDKAVEPISTYGFTKALGEKLCLHYNGYVARSGNVLSSTGSVIPVWEQAIKEGKPIKITDQKMRRYIIDDKDCVEQIWKGYLKKEKLIIPVCDEKYIMDIY